MLDDYINPFTDYEHYLSYGESEDLQIIISNTTEAGIAFDPTDTDFSQCPKSFPGKLLALLKRRYDHFKGDTKGLAIIPCELIDYNGEELYKCLTKLAENNGMDKAFIKWMQTANHFTSTLVDRIVPGYPRNEIEAIREECGYIDNNVVKGEIFHLWVLKRKSTSVRYSPPILRVSTSSSPTTSSPISSARSKFSTARTRQWCPWHICAASTP